MAAHATSPRSTPSTDVSATTPLIAALRRIRDDLTELGIGYALVGGLAVSARAEPRLTRDVDVAVAATDDATAEQVIRDLLGRGYRLTTTIEQTATGRLATARLIPPGHTRLVVDLLFASCGIETAIVKHAELLEIVPGVQIPVARAGHLIAMKLLARDDRQRPQDLDDLRALLVNLPARERARVTTAIEAIKTMGYARGRDLRSAWRDVTRTARRR